MIGSSRYGAFADAHQVSFAINTQGKQRTRIGDIDRRKLIERIHRRPLPTNVQAGIGVVLEERDSPCVDSVHLALVQRDDRVLRSSSSTLGEATTGEGLAGDDSGGPSPPEQDVSDATGAALFRAAPTSSIRPSRILFWQSRVNYVPEDRGAMSELRTPRDAAR